ncbi:tyrosine-type recombinase/integrase [Noviherbaspirillum malthae]|uniref:tyrosine-type recombinase/integrase n=1 Tax=Noviherbaspirillum malthae TaxID=1260987 RepID=UPI001E2B480D|nr:site-specific integrase [Noviherbaspirillum malthae]
MIGTFKYNTVTAYANDLKEWCRYLEEFKVAWPNATNDDLAKFARIMRSTNSPLTGKGYNTKTIIRRVQTIAQFYKWAAGAKLHISEVNTDTLINSDIAKIEVEPLDTEKQHISYLDIPQRAKVLSSLGKETNNLVSANLRKGGELYNNQVQTLALNLNQHISRNLLATIISLFTGLRISETCSLRLADFTHVPSEPSPLEKYSISILGKGRKRRDVDFSGWIIAQIRMYTQHERAEVFASCGKHDHGFILVNPISSRRFAGNKSTPRSLERAFSAACISSGLCKIEPLKRYELTEDGELQTSVINVTQPLFVFHDLRHTFAITTYFLRKYSPTSPDPDPIEYIQKMLGHADREVTTNTYLSSIDRIESMVGDKLIEYMNGKAKTIPV